MADETAKGARRRKREDGEDGATPRRKRASLNPDSIPKPAPLMTPAEERSLLAKLESCPTSTHAAARLRRKLFVQRAKSAMGMPNFNLDEAVGASLLMANDYQQVLDGKSSTRLVVPRIPIEHAMPASTSTATPVRAVIEEVSVARRFSFAERLLGRGGVAGDSLTHVEVSRVRSAYTDRTLKPFIWRDFNCRAPRLALLRSIPQFSRDPEVRATPHYPVDYCYFRPEHLVEVNQLLSTYFWPGIEMSEALEHPEFSVVACYRRLVIGCAFMTPGAYISYVLVHPHWRGGGIARFMIYHLLQTISTKDVTLHVSATNPAMLLYQEFGFKAEQFIVNFYDNYYPDGSLECKNALFLRRRR